MEESFYTIFTVSNQFAIVHFCRTADKNELHGNKATFLYANIMMFHPFHIQCNFVIVDCSF